MLRASVMLVGYCDTCYRRVVRPSGRLYVGYTFAPC